MEDFFFLHGTVISVQICSSMFISSWDFTLMTFRTLMVTSWKVTVWGYQSVFRVFQGLIFFTLQCLSSPEPCGKLLQKAPKMLLLHSIPVFILSSLQWPFSKMSCVPQNRKASGTWDFQSAAYFILASSPFILPCLEPCSMSFPVHSRILWFLSKSSSTTSYRPHILLLLSL